MGVFLSVCSGLSQPLYLLSASVSQAWPFGLENATIWVVTQFLSLDNTHVRAWVGEKAEDSAELHTY